MDLTVLEFADAVGTKENVENFQSRMDNQQYAHYDHQYSQYDAQVPPDDLGVSVGLVMAEQRRLGIDFL